MTRLLQLKALLYVLVCASAPRALADVRLPALIGDNMVLQQGMDARLWGWGDPGERVTVTASWRKSPTETKAGGEGRWAVRIPTPAAGGPYTITVEGKNRITLEQVMIGEVWVCSGQSNMEMGLRPNGIWHKGVLNAAAEIAAADHPDIRLFTVSRRIAMEPQSDCEGAWSACSPETVADFSATAYFFGRKLQDELDVPIGLIHSSWGGTRAEAWTSRETLASLGSYSNDLAEQWLPPTQENISRHRRAEQKREQQRFLLDARNVGFDKGYANVDFDASAWREMVVPGSWEALGADMEIDGVVWFRKEVTIPQSWAGQNLELSVGPVEDCDTTYFNGRKLGSIGYGTPSYWQTPREYRVPSSFVRPGEKNVIAVRVFDDAWSGGFAGSAEQLALRPVDDATPGAISLAGIWKFKVEAVLEPNPIRLAHANCPSVLFNGMINPLVPYPIRGAIWYQGESNHTRGYEYRKLFPAMIVNWRRSWGQGDFPFYYVQIAPFVYQKPDSAAELREAQLMTLSVPNTGMVVTTDISEIDDIHPRNKQDVGRRLALWALAKTYGRDAVVHSGPTYRSMQIEDDRIRVFFDHVGSGLVAKGAELTDFTIAADDRAFAPARARIDGDTVVVSGPGVRKPVAVRFGWSNTPTPNLFNKEGLPASPFRTDEWTDATHAPPGQGKGVSRPQKETEQPPVYTAVEVDAQEVLVENFLGAGVQWSAYPWWDISQDDWQKVFRRLEFMRMRLSRVMLDTFWYCQGFDGNGEPIYTWDTTYMKKLYTLLDWCEQNDTVVMIGEWGRPNGKGLDLATDDPRWTRIIGDFLEHMIRDRGYTCLKYYNLINEPHGSWTGVTWDQWHAAITNLHEELNRRRLLERIVIAAPDGDRHFTTKCLKDADVRRLTGLYDEHWYVFAREVEWGLLELYTREQLRQIRREDSDKPFILGEIGLIDDKNKNDQQLHVYDFWYGVSMADAAIQMIRGGMSGFIAWDLDDSMHFCGDGGESMNALSDKLPADAYQRRKIWGFWSILGAENGTPDDEHMRCWYFTWSVLSRAFPPGCQTLETTGSGVHGLRVAAARIADGDRYDLSFAVVNESSQRRAVRITVPQAGAATRLAKFAYFDTDGDNRVDAWPEVVDADGRDVFPTAVEVLSDVDLRQGLDVVLPSKGVIVLTTLESGDSIPLVDE